ncbi:hypothetical protein I4U23_003737 [Adineta vaga]|nr:hypothetical protein I4U23_003737 [Adineta vaga]
MTKSPSRSERTACKWGRECRDENPDHRARFSHPSITKSHPPKDGGKIQCKWGTKCHDFDSGHRAKYSHPK